MTNECKQQFTLRITQANKTQLIVILYEMLQCYLQEGTNAHAAGDRHGFREAIRKARGCINELLQSLNMEYDIAASLLQLYLYCIRRLAQGEVHNDHGPLIEIEKIIGSLRDAYGKAAESDQSGPVMQNPQTVYAGLTYGKNTLTENMAHQSTNRGLLV